MPDEMTLTEPRTCKRINVTVEVRVAASFPWIHESWHIQDRSERMNRLAHDLNREVKDFVGFLRDHRSQDAIQLEVERVQQDVCSACGKEWEPYFVVEDDDPQHGKTICAHCGAEVPTECDKESQPAEERGTGE